MGFYLYGELETLTVFIKTRPRTISHPSKLREDLNETVQLQFGGMYHDYGLTECWMNRITQDLIDNGTTSLGRPIPRTDGDGKISHQEFDIDGDGFTDLNPYAWWVSPWELTTAAF